MRSKSHTKIASDMRRSAEASHGAHPASRKREALFNLCLNIATKPTMSECVCVWVKCVWVTRVCVCVTFFASDDVGVNELGASAYAHAHPLWRVLFTFTCFLSTAVAVVVSLCWLAGWGGDDGRFSWTQYANTIHHRWWLSAHVRWLENGIFCCCAIYSHALHVQRVTLELVYAYWMSIDWKLDESTDANSKAHNYTGRIRRAGYSVPGMSAKI